MRRPQAKPEPGLVIRFAYLWRSEAAAGRDEAVKDRPYAVLVATTGRDGPDDWPVLFRSNVKRR